MIDKDYSFLRLRDNLTDALNLSESPAVKLQYIGQVQLLPTETYLQITNSPTSINISSYEVHIVDTCGNVLQDVSDYVFIDSFTDTNGINQIKWEFINQFEYYTKPICLRFTETSNGNTWFTNAFLSTAYESQYTIRFDYKNNGYHYGTQYNRANNYQSVRIRAYYNNSINESERSEYHEITTDRTVPNRNIRKIKQRYILQDFDDWTVLRLENMLSCNEIYVNNVRTYSTTPIEFVEREMDSNISEQEMILNNDYEQPEFVFSYQIFEGFNLIDVLPSGVYTLSGLIADGKATFNIPITLNTGTITIHDASDDSIVDTFTESDMTITTNELNITDFTDSIIANGSYYVNMSHGLVSGLGIVYNGISDTTTWSFIVQDGDYDVTDYSSTDYLTT